MTQFKDEGVFNFDTKFGSCSVAWSVRGVDAFELPQKDPKNNEIRCLAKVGQRPITTNPPAFIARLANRVRGHFEGKLDSFEDVPVDQHGVSSFAAKTYKELRRVSPGSVVTYGQLASAIGSKDAARAVGRAMAVNRVLLIIPCHRVVPSDGTYGSFSAQGGPSLKAKMLFVEGVVLNLEHRRGIQILRENDRVIGDIIDTVGPYLAPYSQRADIYNSVVEAIIHQQLSIKAGKAIASRVRALSHGPNFPTPEEFSAIKDSALREAGLSKQKISYVRDLANRVVNKEIDLNKINRMSDEAVVETLTKVKGIGRWTAQMTLIFQLGRLDVLPVDDLGLRNACRSAYGLDASLSPEQLKAMAEKWRPYRSMATWYLWQSLKAGGI